MSTYVGVDVGSSEHAVYAIEKEEEVPVHRATVTNDRDGFEKLEEFLEAFPGSIHLGLEATGNYWKPIFDYLMGLREKLDITLSLINPNEIHQFKKMDLSRVKTDSADAKAIARYVFRFKPQSTPRTNKRLRSLRKLCRYRASRVDEKTRLTQQLNDLLVSVFPEYTDCFGKLSAVSSLTVLEAYPGPGEIANLDLDRLSNLRYGKANHKLGEDKAKKLIEEASNTVGEEYGSGIEITIRHLARQRMAVRREVEDLNEKIAENFTKITPNKLTTMDCIGPVNGAVMTTEIWDVNRFPTATKLNGYVGAYPELSESANYKDPHPEMTKKGNPRLKRAVFTSTMSAINCNPIIKEHYEKQRKRGKDRMVAIGSCMRKLVHIIYGILTSDEEFDPNYEEKRKETDEDKERTRKPQSGSYPEDERSTEFSPRKNNGEKIPTYQLAGGET